MRLLLVTCLVMAAPALGAGVRAPLVFGDSGEWVVLSGDGKVLKYVTRVCGVLPDEVAVAPDLETTVFTAWDVEAQNYLLYACDRNSQEPRLLGDRTGYHAQPSFSGDGQWVYFVHHPRKGGPPGTHDEGANAQLYRVRPDGRNLEALSDSKGCKLSPRPVDADAVVVVHASCDGPRSIDVMRPSDHRLLASVEDGPVSHYPDVAPGGRRLVFTEQLYGRVDIVLVDLETRKRRVLWTLPAGYTATQTRWSSDGRFVLFQQARVVWRLAVAGKPAVERVTEVGEQR